MRTTKDGRRYEQVVNAEKDASRQKRCMCGEIDFRVHGSSTWLRSSFSEVKCSVRAVPILSRVAVPIEGDLFMLLVHFGVECIA